MAWRIAHDPYVKLAAERCDERFKQLARAIHAGQQYEDRLQKSGGIHSDPNVLRLVLRRARNTPSISTGD